MNRSSPRIKILARGEAKARPYPLEKEEDDDDGGDEGEAGEDWGYETPAAAGAAEGEEGGDGPAIGDGGGGIRGGRARRRGGAQSQTHGSVSVVAGSGVPFPGGKRQLVEPKRKSPSGHLTFTARNAGGERPFHL